MDIREYLSSTAAKIVAVLVALAVVVTIAVLALSGGGSAKNAGTTSPGGVKTSAPAEAIPSGYVASASVPTEDPHKAKPAVARPTVMPPKIFATGVCKTALDALRVVLTTYPSGLALDAAGNTKLTAGIATMNKDCDAKTATAFQVQELMPWLNYAVPAKATTK